MMGDPMEANGGPDFRISAKGAGAGRFVRFRIALRHLPDKCITESGVYETC